MSIKDNLKNLGFKEKEMDVYLACLELGTSTALKIAKKAGIKRPYFYDIVESLIKYSLIAITHKGKKRYFTATPPEKLKEIQEEKIKQINELLPQLKAIYNTKGKKPKVLFYEGLDGIEEVNRDTLRYKGELVAFTTEKFLTAKETKLSKEYIKQRVATGIKARVIGSISNELINIRKNDEKELRQTKMLPKDLYTSDVEIQIYSNKVAITNYKEEFGLIIESDEIAKPLKMIFELIWRGGYVE